MRFAGKLSVTVLVGALLAAGCAERWPGATAQGTYLDHQRRAAVWYTPPHGPLVFENIHGGLYLTGQDDPAAGTRLRALVYERSKGDVDWAWSDAGAVLFSRTDSPFLVHALSGQVAAVPIDASTVAGNYWLRRTGGHERMRLQTQTGDIVLEDIHNVGQVQLRTRDGAVELRGLRDVREVVVETESGVVTVVDSQIGLLTIQSVSGSAHFRRSEIADLRGRSQSGGVYLTHTQLGEVDFESVEGSLIQRP